MSSHQHSRAVEVAVSGGRTTSGMTRRGDRLLRPMGPWSPAVHEYLRQAAGFDGAPRLLGVEGDREVLTFIDGDVANDPRWQPGTGTGSRPMPADLALRGAGRLIRELHTATAGFRPVFAIYRFDPRPPGPGEIVPRGDLGPWNTVYRDRIPVAFIDWDAAQPVDPVADLAAAARTFVPLAPPGLLAEAGFDPIPDRAPGCARSWTPTASPTAGRSCQRCSAVHWTRNHRRAGSGPPWQTSAADCDPTFPQGSCRNS